MPVTRSQSSRADASANNPFTPSPERQEAGNFAPEVPSAAPPTGTPAEHTGLSRIEVASRFAHRDMAHVGGVGRHGSQTWLGRVPDDFDRERDMFHVEIQCTFAAPTKFDEADPCDSINLMLFTQAPWFYDRASQERDLMELYADEEDLLPGGIPLD